MIETCSLKIVVIFIKTECPILMHANTHFDRFLPSAYKFGTVYTLSNRCFQICSSRTKSCNESVCLREIVFKNGYPKDFINKWFKKFMNNIDVVKRLL